MHREKKPELRMLVNFGTQKEHQIREEKKKTTTLICPFQHKCQQLKWFFAAPAVVFSPLAWMWSGYEANERDG